MVYTCRPPRWSTPPAGAPALALRRGWTLCPVLPQPRLPKGNYFTLAGRAPFASDLPRARAAGLGVHLTLDLGGQARFGPDVRWVETPDDPGRGPGTRPGLHAEVRWVLARSARRGAGAWLRGHTAQGVRCAKAAITDFVVRGLPRGRATAWSTCLASVARAHQRTGLGEHVAQIGLA